MEEMKIIEIDSLTTIEQINLLYSIFRSTFNYEVENEPEVKKTSWKLKHLISVFLRMYNTE